MPAYTVHAIITFYFKCYAEVGSSNYRKMFLNRVYTGNNRAGKIPVLKY